MNIEWDVLGQVILVSVLLTLAMVGFFSLGIRTIGGAKNGAGGGGAAKSAGYLSFGLCAAAVCYGIWIIAA
ncbi:hypothetical protein FH609_030010 [Streptomyces sp. 3MP-14]|uniref:Uncharacterized protein n=1 Tax=Streptomyces mimosae TaxID=2586635 RepID=A0A5N5ZMH2_9ACTN|nr:MULTISPECIES: hypothetical protein [Streptomyces]KAB8157043.1 hypothetical protein FH607_030595 [Streptomyces mimosae]KAB8172491.1 hypothetical protein FH609_030010 [Streptomyces sp. 3MP-14]